MELKLDQEAIRAAVEKTMGAAVERALGGYDVQQAVAKVITEEVASGTIADAIREAVRTLDRNELIHTLAREIARAVTSATVKLTQEGIVHTIGTLRGVQSYGADAQKQYAAIHAELFGHGAPKAKHEGTPF
jgi:hypothetical protein